MLSILSDSGVDKRRWASISLDHALAQETPEIPKPSRRR